MALSRRPLLISATLVPLLAACTVNTPPPTPAPAPAPIVQAPSDPETVFWESVRDAKNPAEYYAYLQAYPAGRFSALARIRIDALTPKPVKAAPPTPKPPPPAAPSQPLPPPHLQGESTIAEAPAPPVNWAKIDDLSGRAGPLLRSQIMDCWDPPSLPRGTSSYRAEVGIYFDPATGQVRGAAFLGGNHEISDKDFARFVNTALAAPMTPACRALDLRQAGTATDSSGLVLLFALDSPP